MYVYRYIKKRNIILRISSVKDENEGKKIYLYLIILCVKKHFMIWHAAGYKRKIFMVTSCKRNSNTLY